MEASLHVKAGPYIAACAVVQRQAHLGGADAQRPAVGTNSGWELVRASYYPHCRLGNAGAATHCIGLAKGCNDDGGGARPFCDDVPAIVTRICCLSR